MCDENWLHDIRRHALLALPILGSDYVCELIKNFRSRARTLITDEALDGFMRITTTEIKFGTERLLKQKRHQISH
jgi:hypothetical protein